jgi:predicted metal-binding protein
MASPWIDSPAKSGRRLVSEKSAIIFVCVSCRADGDPETRPGAAFLDALRTRLIERNLPFRAESVECLAVCKRPATIALAGDGKWTYVIGDLDVQTNVDDVIESALRFAESENGIVAWKDRPVCFRRGVVSRTPPLPYSAKVDRVLR